MPAGLFLLSVTVSVASALLLIALLIDATRRRGRFPEIVYKGRAWPQRLVQLGWTIALVGTWALASIGLLGTDFFAGASTSYDSYMQAGLTAPVAAGDSVYAERLVFPFYDRGARVWRDSSGRFLRYEYEQGRVPLEFFLAAGLYVILVVRWRTPDEAP